jgi:3-deoxy-manno-octulosonate cytidylyltransferase (CMP-KDO synthetase)
MSFVVLIPARLASTRLPNKPMADIGGAPMVIRVARQAAKSNASRVIIAAEDDIIVQAAREHGIEAIKTGHNHASGTDRLAQASSILELADQTVVVNVQGDEPFIDPELINNVAQLLTHAGEGESSVMGTAACSIFEKTDYLNPNIVKVIVDMHARAISFSRAPIPYFRDWLAKGKDCPEQLPNGQAWSLRHIGIYAYRVDFLRQFSQLTPSAIEQAEALEQMRALAHGYAIKVHVSFAPPSPGVDTPADLELAREIYKKMTSVN